MVCKYKRNWQSEKKRIRKRLVSAQELYYIEETGLQALGVEEKDAQIIRKSIETWDLEEEYERMQQKKIQFYPFFHSDYPEKLKQISSPPYALYVKETAKRRQAFSGDCRSTRMQSLWETIDKGICKNWQVQERRS